DKVSRWVLERPVSIRILLAVVSSILIVLVCQILVFGLGTWQIPPEWSSMAFARTNVQINPVSLRDSLMVAGMFLGTAVGAIFTESSVSYKTDGSVSHKVLRYILGIVVLFIFWMALSGAAKSHDGLGYGMSYLRAAVAGLWVTLGAPYLFLKVGLMRS
ncbi:MAG: hypothetical protein LUQ07_02495, partial [Methanospirillum sp.]|nr:hypothetical protein [Methanospirillum sp.]